MYKDTYDLFFSDSHLNVRHGQTDQEIHQNNADEHHEEKDHEMSREGKNCISILVDKILIFNFPGHHDESFDQGWDRLHVKTLVVGKQDAETIDEQLTNSE